MAARKTKKCNKCGRNKLLSSYSKHAHHSSGLNSICKFCQRDYRMQTRDTINYHKSDRYYRSKKRRDYTHWNPEWNQLVWEEMRDKCRRLGKPDGRALGGGPRYSVAG